MNINKYFSNYEKKYKEIISKVENQLNISSNYAETLQKNLNEKK